VFLVGHGGRGSGLGDFGEISIIYVDIGNINRRNEGIASKIPWIEISQPMRSANEQVFFACLKKRTITKLVALEPVGLVIVSYRVGCCFYLTKAVIGTYPDLTVVVG